MLASVIFKQNLQIRNLKCIFNGNATECITPTSVIKASNNDYFICIHFHSYLSIMTYCSAAAGT